MVDMSAITNYGMVIWGWVWKALLLGGAVGIAYFLSFYYRRQKRYKYIVRIFNKDATGQVIQQPDDKGGIFLDKKTQYRLFKLKKNKFGLDPDEIPYILNSMGKKIVYLLQTGLKNYQFLTPALSDNPGLVFNVQDEDVAWAINAWERYRNPYKNQFLEKIMPFIGMAFVFIVVVVALYYMVVKAGFNAELLRELAASSKEISANLAKASLGSAVVG